MTVIMFKLSDIALKGNSLEHCNYFSNSSKVTISKPKSSLAFSVFISAIFPGFLAASPGLNELIAA